MKIMRNLYFLITVLLIVTSCNKKKEAVIVKIEETPTPPAKILTPLPEKEWTYLFYNDADFNGYDPLNDFKDLVSSNSDINYLVLRDGYNSGADYYYIDEEHLADKLQSLGEVNMGSSITLKNLINFAKKYFPAKRYIIAFYDHGGGWMGACWDESNENDNLTVDEMDTPIYQTGGVDLVMYTAPCLMGSLEASYQMKNSAKCFIASENISGFVYWGKILNDFDTYLKANPSVETHILAEEIIKMHGTRKHETDYGGRISMSAIDLSKINDFVISFNKVVDCYCENNSKFAAVLDSGVQVYYNDYIDVKDLLEKLYCVETDSIAKQLLTEAIREFDNCVIAECHGEDIPDSNGLNIYYPNEIKFSQLYYSPYGNDLNFAADSNWDLLVKQSKSLKSKVVPNTDFLERLFSLNGYDLR